MSAVEKKIRQTVADWVTYGIVDETFASDAIATMRAIAKMAAAEAPKAMTLPYRPDEVQEPFLPQAVRVHD